MDESLEERIGRLERKITLLETELSQSILELRAIRAALSAETGGLRPDAPTTAHEPIQPSPDPSLRAIPSPFAFRARENRSADPISKNPRPAPKQTGLDAGLESYIGANLVSKIGIVLVLIGLGVFVKYAVDNRWLGPLARITLSYVAGGALIFAAWRTIDRYRLFGSVLFAGGIAAAYFTTYGAYAWFDPPYLSHPAAFALMVALTAFAVAAAAKYRQEAIGLFGMVAAYVVPFLLSDGSQNFTGLWTYIALVNTGMLAAAYFNDWRISVRVAGIATWLMHVSVYLIYHPDSTFPRAAAFGFSVYFFVVFYAAVTVYKLFRHARMDLWDVTFILLNTAVFFVFGLAQLETSFDVGRWGQGAFAMAVGAAQCAVAYLIYLRRLTDPKIEPALYLLAAGLGAAAVTTAVPVALKGTWITLLWSAEAVALFAVAGVTGTRIFSRLGLATLILAGISLFMDLQGGYRPGADVPFLFNRIFLTALGYVSALFASLAVLQYRAPIEEVDTTPAIPTAFGVRHGLDTFERTLKNVLPVWGAVALYFILWAEMDGYFAVRYEELFRRFGYAVSAYRSGAAAAFTFAYLAAFVATSEKILPYPSLRTALWPVVLAVIVAVGFPVLYHLYDTDLDLRIEPTPEKPVYLGAVRWAYALGLGALLFAARRHDKLFGPEFPLIARTRSLFAISAHALVLFFLSTELVRVFVPPGPEAYERLEVVQKVGYSLLWGGYALGLMAAGFGMKAGMLRLAGMALAGTTLFKLVVYDLENLPTLLRIVAFVIIGAVFLLISYLYQRYGKNIANN
jgi:uncharacterized membrane protein